MKIAICFSGQPRFVKECYPGIKNNILDPNSENEIDIFVHTWYSDDIAGKVLYGNEISSFSGEAKIDNGIIKEIQDLYSPKRLEFDAPKKFISDIDFSRVAEKYFAGYVNSGMSKDDFCNIKVENLYSMWYSAMKCNLLKREHELTHDKRYDMVIKLRFDNICRSRIILKDMDPEFMHYHSLGQPDGMISDWINISSSANMDTYFSIFFNIKNLIKSLEKTLGVFCSELFIKEVCQKFNIPTQGHNFGIELPKWGKL